MPLSVKDRALVAAAEAIIRRQYVPDWQHLGAALRTASGRVVTAVNLDTYVGRCAVCAEAVALGRAFSEGERAFDTIVAVRWVGRGEATVVSPCGICRELLSDYGDPWVIHPKGRGLGKTRASRLLPDCYDRAGEARSTPQERDHARRRSS
jgi:cytidine deaminase